VVFLFFIIFFVIPTPHFAGEESLQGENLEYKGFLPSVEMTNFVILAITEGRL